MAFKAGVCSNRGKHMKASKPRALAFLILISLLGSASQISASQPNFMALHPGQFQQIDQNLQINIVFVGYQPGNGPRDINEAAFRAVLPQTYRSINRAPASYGIDSPTGLRFTYNYNVVYADASFTDAYFPYLSSIAKPGQVTLLQNLYNGQQARTLTVNQNYKIDATAAEKWLGDHSLSMLGVDPTKYTSLLAAADQQAVAALNIYQTMDYENSAYYAKDAYSKVLAAAQQINVPVEQQASPADYKAHGTNYMFTDDFTPGRRH